MHIDVLQTHNVKKSYLEAESRTIGARTRDTTTETGLLRRFYQIFCYFCTNYKKSYPIMTLNEYQQHALETAIYPDDRRIIYPTLGLTGEAGEVADKVKKVIRDAHEEFTPERRLEIVKEIGDVLWYCATLSRDLGYELEEVAQMNVDKLRSRMQRHLISGNGDNR